MPYLPVRASTIKVTLTIALSLAVARDRRESTWLGERLKSKSLIAAGGRVLVPLLPMKEIIQVLSKSINSMNDIFQVFDTFHTLYDPPRTSARLPCIVSETTVSVTT